MARERSEAFVYFDANPFIYGFEGTPEVAAPIQMLLKRLQDRPGAAVTSELVLGELLGPAKGKRMLPLELRRQIYFGLLISRNFIDMRPVSREIIIGTADLRQSAPLKLPDAIHIMTAVQTGCRYFLSNDRDASRAPARLIQIRPDAAGVDGLLSALS